jgi:hypothetical protein
LKRIAKYILISAFIATMSCGENEPLKMINGEEYFPLVVGQYHIYKVEQTVYKEVEPKITTTMSELKSEVVDSFENLEGEITYVIHRSKRNNDEEPWQYVETWSARCDEYSAVTIEESVPYVSLLFPVVKKGAWDGNTLNTKPEDQYVISDIVKSISNESTTYTDCIIVEQESYLDATRKDERIEYYARNVGLIYKKYFVFDYCTDDACFGQQVIKSGISYSYTLIDHGQL